MLKKKKKLTKKAIKEDKLVTSFNNTLDFIDEYRIVGTLKDRVYSQIRQINKMIVRRES